MTETAIALIPDYGLIVVFFAVALACLAVPLPASMLVLASGAFAATGDLDLTGLLIVTFVAFVVGDQLAFLIASRAGTRLVAFLRARPKVAPMIEQSESLIQKRGGVAVLVSHTVLSPTCPYVSYLCGAGGMGWRMFSVFAVSGAAVWVAAYVGLGYVFATQLTQLASILSQFFGLIFGLLAVFVSFKWVRRAWRNHRDDAQA